MTLRELEKVMVSVYITIIGAREEKVLWTGFHWERPKKYLDKQVLAVEPTGNFEMVITLLV